MFKRSRFLRYSLCFLGGVVAVNIYFGFKNVAEFTFVGEPVLCRSSFPRSHNACIYSRFGIGEQGVTLQINGETVFSKSDMAPGNLNEQITWDESGRVVTFHVNGLGEITYDAETKTQVR